jgi:hypothetical protein
LLSSNEAGSVRTTANILAGETGSIGCVAAAWSAASRPPRWRFESFQARRIEAAAKLIA